MCGSTFAELGEAAMRRLQSIESEEINSLTREASGGAGSSAAVEAEKAQGEGRRDTTGVEGGGV